MTWLPLPVMVHASATQRPGTGSQGVINKATTAKRPTIAIGSSRQLRGPSFRKKTGLQGSKNMNASISASQAGLDPEHVAIIEPVKGSDIPVRLMYVETIDGLYAPIGLRTPHLDGHIR